MYGLQYPLSRCYGREIRLQTRNLAQIRNMGQKRRFSPEIGLKRRNRRFSAKIPKFRSHRIFGLHFGPKTGEFTYVRPESRSRGRIPLSEARADHAPDPFGPVSPDIRDSRPEFRKSCVFGPQYTSQLTNTRAPARPPVCQPPSPPSRHAIMPRPAPRCARARPCARPRARIPAHAAPHRVCSRAVGACWGEGGPPSCHPPSSGCSAVGVRHPP